MSDLEQPSPLKGGETVFANAYAGFRATAIHQREKGLEKYGTVLTTMNGRDAYQDFLQEQVDGLMYATQLHLEARILADLVIRSIGLLESVKRYIDGDDHEAVVVTDGVAAYVEEAQSCIERSGLAISVKSDRADSVQPPSDG